MRIGVPLPALVEGNVYSQTVALAMARAGKNRTNADIVLSTTGVMENLDTRPHHDHVLPGTIFYATLLGQNEYAGSFWLPPSSRKRMKNEIAWYMFHQLNAVLDAHEIEKSNDTKTELDIIDNQPIIASIGRVFPS